MRRVALLLCLSAVALTSACSDRSTSPGAVAPGLVARANSQGTPLCVSDTRITELIGLSFANGSPDAQSALGKWSNIQKQRAAGDREALIQEKVIDLANFMFVKKREGKLLAGASASTLAQFAELVNGLFCYAGLLDYFYDGGDGRFIYPTDDAQTVDIPSGQAAMYLPANAVSSPTLITIRPTTATLNTKLDKYPQNYEFSKFPADEPFTKLVVTEVCAATPSPAIYEKLVLGHNKSDGTFELLPKAPPQLTACPTTQASASSSMTDRLLALVLPKKLHAAMMFGGGGVAGSVLELSPIGPVDPRILVTPNATSSSAPIGSLVTPSPLVTLATPNGTKIDDVRVDFATLSGGTYLTGATLTPTSRTTMDGSISPDSAGVASTTWRLGTALGTYGMSATPQLGGTNALPGVEFVPAVRIFEATTTAPSQLVITQSPASGAAFVAGVAHTPSTIVEVRDALGRRVDGYTGAVSMDARSGLMVQTVSGTPTLNAVGGVATFSNLSITKTGTFTMAPSASFGTTPLTASGSYNVVINAAAAFSITAVNTVPATSTVGAVLKPVVEVRDQFGNLSTGTTVYFKPTPNENNVSPATALTNELGRSTTDWTALVGTNSLFASLDAVPQENRSVEFTTTVLTSPAVSLSCSEKGQRDPITSTAVRLVKAPASGNTVRPIKAVQFYLSINGNAKVPTDYQLTVTASYTSAAGVPLTAVSSEPVPLRGNASEDLANRFDFTPAFTPRANTPVVFRVTGPAISNDIRMNVGPCLPGDRNCRSRCEAKTISATPGTGFDLFTTPFVRDGMKLDLFSN